MPTVKVSERTRKSPALSMKYLWACHCCYVVVSPANKYGGWKGGGWLCGILGLPLMFCAGRSSRIGAGSFHCGYLSGGFYGAVVERWDWQVDFGIVLAAFGYWDLGVDSLWQWGTLGYWYFQTPIALWSISWPPVQVLNFQPAGGRNLAT